MGLSFGEFAVISRPGSGKIGLFERNRKPCVCGRCGVALPPRQAFRFRAARRSGRASGYWCVRCASEWISEVPAWHHNPATDDYFPASWVTNNLLDGNDLAAAFSSQFGGVVVSRKVVMAGYMRNGQMVVVVDPEWVMQEDR